MPQDAYTDQQHRRLQASVDEIKNRLKPTVDLEELRAYLNQESADESKSSQMWKDAGSEEQHNYRKGMATAYLMVLDWLERHERVG